jgi:hypothetical protein
MALPLFKTLLNACLMGQERNREGGGVKGGGECAGWGVWGGGGCAEEPLSTPGNSTKPNADELPAASKKIHNLQECQQYLNQLPTKYGLPVCSVPIAGTRGSQLAHPEAASVASDFYSLPSRVVLLCGLVAERQYNPHSSASLLPPGAGGPRSEPSPDPDVRNQAIVC